MVRGPRLTIMYNHRLTHVLECRQGIDAVPQIYLYKKTGEAIPFEGDQHDLEGLMAFALGKLGAKIQGVELVIILCMIR